MASVARQYILNGNWLWSLGQLQELTGEQHMVCKGETTFCHISASQLFENNIIFFIKML